MTGRRPWEVDPDPVELERAKLRDHLADDIERCRRTWHDARAARDDAYRALHDAVRAELVAENAYRAAVAAHEAQK